MPHLVCRPYTTEEEQPDWFEVTIDSGTMVVSTAQTVNVDSVGLYYSVFQYKFDVSHTYSIVAVQDDPVLGEEKSSAATGSFTTLSMPTYPSSWRCMVGGGMKVEITGIEERKETAQLLKEEKEKLISVSIEASEPSTLLVYARDGIGSSGKMYKGG